MRARRLVGWFLCTASSVFVLSALACSTQSSPPPRDSGPEVGAGVEGSASSPGQAASGAPTGAATGGTSATAEGPGVELTREPPDGGVVMNNAQPSKDAGSSDRLQPIIDVVAQNRDKFRGCFDAWSKKNPPAAGSSPKEYKVVLSLKLKASGELESAAFKSDESDVKDKDAESCMSAVAKSLKFPASPSNRDTTYNHPFFFKPKL